MNYSDTTCLCSTLAFVPDHRYIDAVVVVDGYDSTNTNDMTRQKRQKGNAGTTVTFTGDTRSQ